MCFCCACRLCHAGFKPQGQRSKREAGPPGQDCGHLHCSKKLGGMRPCAGLHSEQGPGQNHGHLHRKAAASSGCMLERAIVPGGNEGPAQWHSLQESRHALHAGIIYVQQKQAASRIVTCIVGRQATQDVLFQHLMPLSTNDHFCIFISCQPKGCACSHCSDIAGATLCCGSSSRLFCACWCSHQSCSCWLTTLLLAHPASSAYHANWCQSNNTLHWWHQCFLYRYLTGICRMYSVCAWRTAAAFLGS